MINLPKGVEEGTKAGMVDKGMLEGTHAIARLEKPVVV